MAKEVVSVVVSRKKMKKPTNRMSKRRKLRSALKRIFNYMKSDSYMFAPLFRRSQSSPPVSSGEVSFKAPMKKKEKKLIEDVNEYLRCDAYMYAPLASAYAYDGTTTPPSGVENADVSSNPNPNPIPLKQSERVKHTTTIFHQNYHSHSSTTTGKVLPQKKPGYKVVH